MAEWERVGDVGVFYGAGRFSRGQLGLPQLVGEQDASSLPQFGVSDRLVGESLAAVAAGMEHSLFLTASGKVFACGTNRLGQCGVDGGNEILVPTPVPLPPRRSRRRARKSSSNVELTAARAADSDDGDDGDEAQGEDEEGDEEGEDAGGGAGTAAALERRRGPSSIALSRSHAGRTTRSSSPAAAPFSRLATTNATSWDATAAIRRGL